MSEQENARILPLKGKYYGTQVELSDGTIRTFWYMGNWKPSKRQLGNMSAEEWKKEPVDTHFESEQCYAIAIAICKAFNKLPFDIVKTNEWPHGGI